MIPDKFESEYPSVSAVLHAIRFPYRAVGGAGVGSKSKISEELSPACRDETAIVELIGRLFNGQPQPDGEFLDFSMTACLQLGPSTESRTLIGRIWAYAAETWNSEQRKNFLFLLLRDPDEVFQTLDIAVILFQRVRFVAEEVSAWLCEAHRCVRKDAYQTGFWTCVDTFCSTSPHAAMAVVGGWLDVGPVATPTELAARLLRVLRVAVTSNANLASDFLRLEERLNAPGHPAWRGLYIQSLADLIRTGSLSENNVLEVRDRYVHGGAEEETAWCFLLKAIVCGEKSSWKWARRELMKVAGGPLTDVSKYWVILAALRGVETAEEGDPVSGSDWRGVLRALFPIAAENISVWQEIHNTLISLANANSFEMRELVRDIASYSGRTWVETIKQQKFPYFFAVLRETQLAQGVCTDLCFGSGATQRQLGVLIFNECQVEELDPNTVRSTRDQQLELLLLEARRRQIRDDALARLHACLMERVKESGPSLSESFYEEASRQCLNTAEYRYALLHARPQDEKLKAIASEVEERLLAIDQAVLSPAFRMQVPGLLRARKLHDRSFRGSVSNTVKQSSEFLSFFPTVHNVYGSGIEPRISSNDTAPSAAIEIHSPSESAAFARLESIDPEGVWLRRMAARARVKAFEEAAGARSHP